MATLGFSMQPHSPDFAPLVIDERRVPARRKVVLQVVEVYPGFGSAWAIDDDGERFVINYKSDGVDVTNLELGQKLVGDVSRFGYVITAAV
jgi:hypothetical protein